FGDSRGLSRTLPSSAADLPKASGFWADLAYEGRLAPGQTVAVPTPSLRQVPNRHDRSDRTRSHRRWPNLPTLRLNDPRGDPVGPAAVEGLRRLIEPPGPAVTTSTRSPRTLSPRAPRRVVGVLRSSIRTAGLGLTRTRGQPELAVDHEPSVGPLVAVDGQRPH